MRISLGLGYDKDLEKKKEAAARPRAKLAVEKGKKREKKKKEAAAGPSWTQRQAAAERWEKAEIFGVSRAEKGKKREEKKERKRRKKNGRKKGAEISASAAAGKKRKKKKKERFSGSPAGIKGRKEEGFWMIFLGLKQRLEKENSTSGWVFYGFSGCFCSQTPQHPFHLI